MTPILLLEINEIPWRLIDHYSGRSEYPNVRRFFERSHQYTTVAVDTGELSPWVTWPTLHRGMNNERHGIKNLGQNPATFRGKPIWQEIREQDGVIGICGSMQSWPPLEPGVGGFYIPDTFAHDAACIPGYVSALQAFNLSQVRKNARVVSSALPQAKQALGLISSFYKTGIRISTGMRLASQLVVERFNPSVTARRPVFQTILFWDVFRKHFHPRNPPQFSTFFTNHVAGIMHRYWHDVFPEDFPHSGTACTSSKEPLMRFAIKTLDDMLADVLRWTALNPDLVVIFASSMGQDAIHRDYHEGVELVVEDLTLLMSNAGIARYDYHPLLAMAPQIAVEVQDADKRALVRKVLEEAYCGAGVSFIRVQEIGASLSITVGTPTLEDMATGTFFINCKNLPWEAAGIRRQNVEPGTGYHIPEGSLAVYSEKTQHQTLCRTRARVNSDRMKEWMLNISRDGIDQISPPAAV